MGANLLEAAGLVLDPVVIVTIVLAALYGLVLGAVPGLTATMAMALMVPFIMFMPTLPALAAIVAMHAAAILAGDIPGALVRIPGTPASASYVEDSYRLTQRGRGAEVVGVHVIGASVGGLAGVAVLVVAAPMLANVALRFTTFEYFWLAILGLSGAVIISRGSMVKGAIATVLGLLLSTVGFDVSLGYPRFTAGSPDLLGGIGLIPAMIGLFGLSQVLSTVTARIELGGSVSVPTKGALRAALTSIRRYWRHIPRSTTIGIIVGALPGAGPDIAAYVSYAATKNASKTPQEFGKGSIEPIVSVSPSNNSSIAAAWVPTLVLGIPGDAVTAMMIGVLLMHGLRPGPGLFVSEAPLLFSVYLVFAIANLLLLPIGYLAVKASSRLLSIPHRVLMPIVVLFCIVGSFAVNSSLFDVAVMGGMGLLGFILTRREVPVAPVLLGLILGPIIEQNFMSSVLKTDWQLLPFFTRPVSAVLALLTFALLFAPTARVAVRRGLTSRGMKQSPRPPS